MQTLFSDLSFSNLGLWFQVTPILANAALETKNSKNEWAGVYRVFTSKPRCKLLNSKVLSLRTTQAFNLNRCAFEPRLSHTATKGSDNGLGNKWPLFFRQTSNRTNGVCPPPWPLEAMGFAAQLVKTLFCEMRL